MKKVELPDDLYETLRSEAAHADMQVEELLAGYLRLLLDMKILYGPRWSSKQVNFPDEPQPSYIRTTKEVMGGDACIRDTRIPVWLLVSYKQQGLTDRDLLLNYPQLDASDLIAAWNYFAAHSKNLLRQMRKHEQADRVG